MHACIMLLKKRTPPSVKAGYGPDKAALNQLYDNVVAAITMASQNSIHTHDVMLLIYMIYRVMHTLYERIQGHLDRICYLT